mmetsp:Transcript_70813/g.162354  ORF Transcript_70813/g.162354 Transcript_70813/m.162354 type:complete len:206 (+) Transcript_70813:430-1047(+)
MGSDCVGGEDVSHGIAADLSVLATPVSKHLPQQLGQLLRHPQIHTALNELRIFHRPTPIVVEQIDDSIYVEITSGTKHMRVKLSDNVQLRLVERGDVHQPHVLIQHLALKDADQLIHSNFPFPIHVQCLEQLHSSLEINVALLHGCLPFRDVDGAASVFIDHGNHGGDIFRASELAKSAELVQLGLSESLHCALGPHLWVLQGVM